MPGLILGSTSAYRRDLMERLQVPFTCEAPGVNEDDVKKLGHEPLATVQELARRKAQCVFGRNPTCVVIASDQAVVVDNELLDKPGDRAGAIEQLTKLRGREHRLITAVTIAHSQGLTEFCDITRLVMRGLTDGEIARYVDADKPFDCAGSYKIEQLGITLFDRIDSHDHTAITGLPMLQLSSELRKIGVPLP
ncbi:MAG: septum formation protein [Planctomycetota bacterium]|jgi:septum formation protein